MRHALALASLLVVGNATTVSAQSSGPAAPAAAEPREWTVPYGADTRPRDPYADAQGRVWFVGQNGNYVAHLDTRTNQFRRFEIDSGTHPHNLVVEKGMVWFTGNRNNRIVRLDPSTGKLTTFMIPDTTVRDPHTMIFDPRSGVAWFTAQNSGVVGRFEPATGRFRLWRTGAGTRPYGIVLDSRGQPWFDLFGTNKLATIEPGSAQIKTFTIGAERTRPRRIAITSDDQIYWGDYSRGFVGHLDPKTGATAEWAMPAGATALPYAMATDDRDVVWLAQNGRANAPATLVAFDPRTKTFGAEIPVGRPGPNTIRHMTFEARTRQIWFGTDQGTIGRISVPAAVLLR
jgi:virginiamycin B lyase